MHITCQVQLAMSGVCHAAITPCIMFVGSNILFAPLQSVQDFFKNIHTYNVHTYVRIIYPINTYALQWLEYHMRINYLPRKLYHSRKIYIGSVHYQSFYWYKQHKMMACQLIFVQPIRGLILWVLWPTHHDVILHIFANFPIIQLCYS